MLYVLCDPIVSRVYVDLVLIIFNSIINGSREVFTVGCIICFRAQF